MTQPWIISAKRDGLFILLPPFLVLVLVAVFYDQIVTLSDIAVWFFVVVLVDVAHVYSTLFKTYFSRRGWEHHARILKILPLLSLGFAMLLYQFGELWFWRGMAYIALFHFIRQQYGFFKLYMHTESVSTSRYYIEIAAIYSATLYPVAYWFFGPKRAFGWFVENDFLRYESEVVVLLSGIVFIAIQVLYVGIQFRAWMLDKYINIPKNLVWLGTLLSWNMGIIYYNNDIVFSIFNIISHGVPYLALIFFNILYRPAATQADTTSRLSRYRYRVLGFLLIVFCLAMAEELLWDVAVWREHIFNFGHRYEKLLWLIVPLLSVPQLTHYILDGFIWKGTREKK